MLIICKEEAVDAAIKVLQGHFQVKDPTSLEHYLGVQIVQNDDGKKAWLGQPTIIKSLEKQFGERVAKKKMIVTPGTPGLIGGKVDEKTQSMYRSGVGTLLHLTKHSRPDITNPVRELSKSMDGVSMVHVTEMYRVINFSLEMRTLGLRMVPIFRDGIWKLEELSDSDFANDEDTRYSIYGYIIYFCGIPVAWKSESMKSVVLCCQQLKQSMWQLQKWSRRPRFCTKCLLKPKSDRDRQTDCRAEIQLGMCVESHLNKPLTFRKGFTM